MSGRTAAVLCLVAFFAAAAPRREWLTAAWSALAADVVEPAANLAGDEVGPGWLVDPNG